MEKTDVRGVLFDNVTKEEAVSLISKRLEDGIFTAVFTPNSEIVQSCVENRELMEIISFADVTLPDGVGVIKAARILKTPLKEKVAGVELGEELFRVLDPARHSFFLFGGKPEENGLPCVAAEAGQRMTEKYSCSIVGARHGYVSKSGAENDETVRLINESGADVLYVCLGYPTQERWIAENSSRLENVKLVLALGGSLDIYANRVKRAPSVFINAGLEWLWRLLCEPSRFIRMMKLPKFYIGTVIFKIKNDRKNRKAKNT